MTLSEKAEQLLQDHLEPLMIAINHDAQQAHGKLYEQDTLFKMAVSLHLYALSKGKTIVIDPTTKMVILQ